MRTALPNAAEPLVAVTLRTYMQAFTGRFACRGPGCREWCSGDCGRCGQRHDVSVRLTPTA